jgi:hypothetical protein
MLGSRPDVLNKPSQQRNTVTHHPKGDVALVAQQTPNAPGVMAVVDVIAAFAHRRPAAHSADATLPYEKGVVVLDGELVQLAQVGGSRLFWGAAPPPRPIPHPSRHKFALAIATARLPSAISATSLVEVLQRLRHSAPMARLFCAFINTFVARGPNQLSDASLARLASARLIVANGFRHATPTTDLHRHIIPFAELTA